MYKQYHENWYLKFKSIKVEPTCIWHVRTGNINFMTFFYYLIFLFAVLLFLFNLKIWNIGNNKN